MVLHPCSALIARLASPPLAAGLLLLTAAAPVAAEGLGVELGEPVLYRCSGARELVVRYGRLSDDSLAFVRLQPPGEQPVTLPQLVSGSGARYSNGQLWQWWSQGEEGFLQRQDDQGEWQTVLEGCLTDSD
jgi:membrane-bound inhibitor of C-type lysozyme